jgi:hypothetical protein
MIILLAGTIGRSVTGGQAWANLNYLLGLRALGHDAYYIEDVGDWSETYDWQTQCNTTSLDLPAAFIRDSLTPYQYGDRWTYRTTDDCRGMSSRQLSELCAAADLLIIRGVPMLSWRDEYDLPRRRVFIDVDPGFTQLRMLDGEHALCDTVERCETLFTYGTAFGQSQCLIPSAGRTWRPTIPPIDVSAWSANPPATDAPFSTIVRWRGVHDVTLNGVRYGQRDQEFPKFFDMPRLTGERFRVALLGDGRSALATHGWDVADGGEVTTTTDSYRSFIVQSKAEFGIAKQCYVDMRGGWISDRSVCYLAAGRPVVVQDTGVSDEFRGKSGFLTYRDRDEAVAAIAEVSTDYAFHAAGANALARDRFDAPLVVDQLVKAACDAPPH